MRSVFIKHNEIAVQSRCRRAPAYPLDIGESPLGEIGEPALLNVIALLYVAFVSRPLAASHLRSLILNSISLRHTQPHAT